MEGHVDFTAWAAGKGVKIHGVSAHRFPGRGLGIVADQDIEENTCLVESPTKALRTVHTVPKRISRQVGKITVHGLLAVDLSLDTSPARAPWRAVLPTPVDFRESMPFMWPPELQVLLAPASRALLENQLQKYKTDWATVSAAYPELAEDLYLYNWLVVNTRTFYYVADGAKKPKSNDDCMALNPFADYFNHSDKGCPVEFGKNGYTITTDRSYKKGEEIYISYGNHSNDFLLVEYGFILSENKWDELLLDPVILPRLTSDQQELLKSHGFFGKYVLDRKDVCYRTQVVLMLLCASSGAWRRFLDGTDDGSTHQSNVDLLLLELLEECRANATRHQDHVLNLKVGLEVQKQTLQRRWTQALDMLTMATARITSREGLA